MQSDIDGKNHLALSEDGTSGVKLLPLPDMQGSQAVCIMYMDHVGFQARYASFTMICSIWARRPDMHHRDFVTVICSRWARRKAHMVSNFFRDVCVFITAGPFTKLCAWGRRRVEDMCYEIRRAEACVD